jgi:hypothetical protein
MRVFGSKAHETVCVMAHTAHRDETPLIVQALLKKTPKEGFFLTSEGQHFTQ